MYHRNLAFIALATLLIFVPLAVHNLPAQAESPEMSLDPSSAVPGQIVTVSGSGFKRGVSIEIIWKEDESSLANAAAADD
jgi:hypothetical protein